MIGCHPDGPREVNPTEVTGLLNAWYDGDPQALRRLVPEVVDELRQMARRYLAREKRNHTYQPTDLIQEVYLRLAGRRVQAFRSRSEFFAFTARLMRQILTDYARSKRRVKRGGDALAQPLEEVPEPRHGATSDCETLLAVSEAVGRLGRLNPRHRQVVELRYYLGLTVPEIALALELSPATVERDWAVARRWLAHELAAQGS